jgi:hypothetical protein
MKVSKPCLFNSYGEGWRLSLLLSPDSVKDARRLVDDLKGKDLDCDIKVHRERRSLTANAYAWQLMSQIGKAINPPIPNDEVYEIMLRRYAPVTVVSTIRSIDFTKFASHAELFADDGNWLHWKVYKGSSEMDSKEMSVFINGIKSEAEELGIETLTPAELEALYAQIH